MYNVIFIIIAIVVVVVNYRNITANASFKVELLNLFARVY